MMNPSRQNIDDLLRFQQYLEDGLKPVEIGRLLYGNLTNEEALEKLEQLKHALDFSRSFSGGNNGSK